MDSLPTSRRYLRLVSRDGEVMEGPCHRAAASYMLASDFHFDEMEHLTLRALRLICSAFGEGTVDAHEAAHEMCERAIGLMDSVQLVVGMTSLLRAIRRERSVSFGYLNANCPVCRDRITDEEALVMQLLRSSRRGDLALTRKLISELVGQEAASTTTAAVELARNLATFSLKASPRQGA